MPSTAVMEKVSTRFVVDKRQLHKAISYVMTAISAKPNQPILSNFLIEWSDDELKVSGFDLSIAIQKTLPITIDAGSEGGVCVDARAMVEMVGALPDMIDFVFEDQMLVMTSNGSTFNLPTLPTDEYPSLPFNVDDMDAIPSDILINAIKTTVSCTASEGKGQIVLEGMKLLSDGENLKAYATDGKRASRFSKEWEGSTFEMVLPAKHARALTSGINTDEVDFSFVEGKNLATFAWDNTSFCCRTFENRIPPIDHFWDGTITETLMIDVATLTDALKTVDVVAKQGNGNAYVEATVDEMVIRSSDIQKGASVVTVPCDASGDIEFVVPMIHIQSLLAGKKGDIKLSFQKPTKPVSLNVNGDSSWDGLFIPIQTR